MERKNLLLLFAAIIGTYVVISMGVAIIDPFNGVGLSYTILDEFRIHVMSNIPGFGDLPEGVLLDCWITQHELVPNCDRIYHGYGVWLPGYRVETNSLGLRSPEYPPEKGQDTIRLFMIGDSFTFGGGVDNDETFAHLLSDRFGERFPSRNFEYYNLAHGSTSTDIMLMRVQEYSYLEPDIMVVQLTNNDLWGCGDLHDLLIEEHGVDIEAEGETYVNSLVDHFHDLPLDQQCSCFMHYLNLLKEYALERDILFVVFNPHPKQLEFCFDESFREGIHYYSDESIDASHQLSRKDPHFNRKGHAYVADVLFQFMEPTLAEVLDPTAGPQ